MIQRSLLSTIIALSLFDINELKLKYPSGKFLTNYRNKGAGGAEIVELKNQQGNI